MGNKHILKPIDITLFLVMICLIMIGFIMILSTSSVVGFSSYGDSYYFIKKHVVYLIIGACAFFVGLRFPHQHYKRLAMPGLFFSTILIIATLIPGVGLKIGGARRWLDVGIMSVQPVEVAKFFVIVFLALGLANKGEKLKHFFKGSMPILGMAMVPVGLLTLQPDLGNTILLLMITFILLFLSPMRLSHLFGLIFSGVSVVVVNVLTHPYQMARIKGFLSPWDDPLGRNYHIIQSFIAIGSGGFFGLGLGESKLKYYYLPLHYSDFIFSIICEEGGFITALIVLLLYGLLFYRGVKIGVQSGDPFSFYLAIGLTLLLTLQALINIGVVTGVLPVTGIPLTFLSFGGTSLVMSMFFIGVILNISRYRFSEEDDQG